MRAPAFWSAPPQAPGWQAHALRPLSALYAAATTRRVARWPDVHPQVPVICVGNINAGGTGKSPTVIALQERLRARGVEAVVVTRGYGGRLAGPVRVDPARMTARDVGDEALMLAAFGAVFASRDRAEAARAAEASGCGAILLDDGLQNPAVAKDLTLVVVDAAVGFGNGRVIPAGPLREPVAAGLQRADLLLVIGEAADRQRFAARWPDGPLPRLEATLEPLATGMDWDGLRVVAFAGIGRPAKFFATLRNLGAHIVEAVPLSDHQPFAPALLNRLSRLARQKDAQLVTTEKDAVRLPPDFRREVLTVPVRLRWIDARPLDAALDRLFPAERAR
ncbi:tetraacyldisaccharide 4'-kinase [Roseitranquillus sediminis]|uniref:tetraacyldisaccharide 4'-kinase n=1 Tax=Roseitranquillus sediminis TaxID=2809051 RepID=UPI001D0C6530|nr:tetraacyldisaccharide 4'-kinase [Roseitranquillus sediminis]MBM9593465.1 tetraacyldisaccharide 4'-kinase [Roseitranquillus sediminis]